jgi:trehalose 6-phosphate phosphatase
LAELAEMAELAELAESTAPVGVSVERKPVAVTLHFRHAPGEEPWVVGFADEQRARLGVLIQPGRMAIELRPGIGVDKGTVVRDLARDCAAACCFGDDLGDLSAFAALGDLASSGLSVVRVAVTDDESPAAVSEAADITVSGPTGAMELLRAVLAEARS